MVPLAASANVPHPPHEPVLVARAPLPRGRQAPCSRRRTAHSLHRLGSLCARRARTLRPPFPYVSARSCPFSPLSWPGRCSRPSLALLLCTHSAGALVVRMRVQFAACGGVCGDAERMRDSQDAACGCAKRALSAAARPLFVACAGASAQNRPGGHRGRARRRVCGAPGAAVRAHAARAPVPASFSEARPAAAHAAPRFSRRVCAARRPRARRVRQP